MEGQSLQSEKPKTNEKSELTQFLEGVISQSPDFVLAPLANALWSIPDSKAFENDEQFAKSRLQIVKEILQVLAGLKLPYKCDLLALSDPRLYLEESLGLQVNKSGAIREKLQTEIDKYPVPHYGEILKIYHGLFNPKIKEIIIPQPRGTIGELIEVLAAGVGKTTLITGDRAHLERAEVLLTYLSSAWFAVSNTLGFYNPHFLQNISPLTLDALITNYNANPNSRIVLVPVEAVISQKVLTESQEQYQRDQKTGSVSIENGSYYGVSLPQVGAKIDPGKISWYGVDKAV